MSMLNLDKMEGVATEKQKALLHRDLGHSWRNRFDTDHSRGHLLIRRTVGDATHKKGDFFCKIEEKYLV